MVIESGGEVGFQQDLPSSHVEVARSRLTDSEIDCLFRMPLAPPSPPLLGKGNSCVPAKNSYDTTNAFCCP